MKTFLILVFTISMSTNITIAAEFRDVTTVPGALEYFQDLPFTVTANTPDGLANLTAKALSFEDGSTLQVKIERTLPNNLGRSIRFRQTLNDIPIWHAEVVIQETGDGDIVGIFGQAAYNLDMVQEVSAIEHILTEQDALLRAKEHSSISQGKLADDIKYEDEEVNLIYFMKDDGNLRISYHITFLTIIRYDDRSYNLMMPVYIIDAQNGDVLDFYDNLKHVKKGVGPGGNEKTGLFEWGVHPLPKFEVIVKEKECIMDSQDMITGVTTHFTSNRSFQGPWKFTCFKNEGKEINGGFSPLNDAHGFGMLMVEMFKEWYGKGPLKDKFHLYVNYGRPGVRGQAARWRQLKDKPSYAIFNTVNIRNNHPFTVIDVVAHEIAHGFTDENSGFVYKGQSGAIDEAFSDMSGEALEYYIVSKYGKFLERTMPDFLVGADLYYSDSKKFERDMCDPPNDGNSIDYVLQDDGLYEDIDVHYSSGIYNKVFCILSQRDGWNVKKAFDIFVVANQTQWSSNEKLKSGAEDVIRAVKILNNNDEGIKYEYKDVLYAFNQVGIKLQLEDVIKD